MHVELITIELEPLRHEIGSSEIVVLVEAGHEMTNQIKDEAEDKERKNKK